VALAPAPLRTRRHPRHQGHEPRALTKEVVSARVTEPKFGQWHKIRVAAQGPKIQAHLNDALLLNHDDKTFTGGWVGLWTKADCVTEFADLEIAGTRTR
jgi:hypothetical protein